LALYWPTIDDSEIDIEFTADRDRSNAGGCDKQIHVSARPLTTSCYNITWQLDSNLNCLLNWMALTKELSSETNEECRYRVVQRRLLPYADLRKDGAQRPWRPLSCQPPSLEYSSFGRLI